MDSRNGVEHKCPCCGYETEWDWRKPQGKEFIKGDESFIRIKNNCGNTTTFKTDRPKEVDWGLPDTEVVTLLGCPKCGMVSFKFD